MTSRWCRCGWLVVIPMCLLLVMTSGPQSVGAQATPVTAPGPQYTPLLPAVLAPPRWFRGADEQIHLVYELILTNAFAVPVDLTELAVIDADDGTVVSTLSGSSLRAATSLLGNPNQPVTSLPAGTVGVVWLDVPFPAEDDLPAASRTASRCTFRRGCPCPRRSSRRADQRRSTGGHPWCWVRR